MIGLRTPRLRAILQALFVTFLWSTSWVLVKIGLEDIPAVTFAGLRYFLAIPLLFRKVC
jgi:drug/metabolite transporter (DMT)-like permease